MSCIHLGLIVGDVQSTGTPPRYFRESARQLNNDPRIKLTLFCKGPAQSVFDESVNIHQLPENSGPPRWHRYTNDYDLDLIHIGGTPLFGAYPASRASVPVIATSHGVRHWVTQIPKEAQFTGRYKWQARVQDWLGAIVLDHVFCVSQYVADTLLSKAPYSDSDLDVTYESIDNSFFSQNQHNPPKDAPDKYILHIATDPVVKNTETAIKAVQNCSYDVSLVVAGLQLEDIPDELHQDVTALGFVGSEELVQWYDHAECLLHPSFHETFGRPIVEAMSRRTPVISSRACAIPEITDGAALLINNPVDAEEFANALDNLLSNTSVVERLCKKGQRRARKFTWENHLDRVIPKFYSIINE